MRFDVGASESHVVTGMPASIARLIVSVEELAVERRDGDAVDALRDVRLEDLLLLQLIRRRRRVPQHLDVAEFLRRVLGADLRVVEDRDVERLRNDREAHLARRRGVGRGGGPGTADGAAGGASAATGGEQQRHDEEARAIHDFELLLSSN